MSGHNGTGEGSMPTQAMGRRTGLNVRIGRTAYAPGTTAQQLAGASERQLTTLLGLITESGKGPENKAADAEHDLGLSIALSGALDAEWPEELRKVHECVHETCVRKANDTPKRGETLIDSRTLGIRVTVAKAWELPGRHFSDMRSWGLKLDIEQLNELGVSAPRNYTFGFFGSWQDEVAENGNAVISAERAWRIVIDTLGSGAGTGSQDRELAERLDRRAGRHYADTLARAGGSEDALRRAVTRCGPPRE